MRRHVNNANVERVTPFPVPVHAQIMMSAVPRMRILAALRAPTRK